MKKIIKMLHTLIVRADRYWQELSRRKQRNHTILFFAIYLLLTAITVLQLCFHSRKAENPLSMEHIEGVKQSTTGKSSSTLTIKKSGNEK